MGAPTGSARVSEDNVCLILSRTEAAEASGARPELSPCTKPDDRKGRVETRLALVWDVKDRFQVTASSFNSDRPARRAARRREVSIFFQTKTLFVGFTQIPAHGRVEESAINAFVGAECERDDAERCAAQTGAASEVDGQDDRERGTVRRECAILRASGPGLSGLG